MNSQNLSYILTVRVRVRVRDRVGVRVRVQSTLHQVDIPANIVLQISRYTRILSQKITSRRNSSNWKLKLKLELKLDSMVKLKFCNGPFICYLSSYQYLEQLVK